MNGQQYLELYKKLEKSLRRKYKIDQAESVRLLFNSKKELYNIKNNFNFLAELRNLYAHVDSSLIDNVISINEDTEKFINDMNEHIVRKQTVYVRCVKFSDLFVASYDDFVYTTVQKMKSLKINSIIIVENQRIVGLFREETLLMILKDSVEVMVDDTLKFKDIKPLLKIIGHEDDILYLRATVTTEELYHIYYEKFDKGQFLSFIFITQDGTKNTRLYGLITPYRIASLML